MGTKNPEKHFLLSLDPGEKSSGGQRWGGPQRGGPSYRSWQMILPPLQMQPSCAPHEERGQ